MHPEARKAHLRKLKEFYIRKNKLLNLLLNHNDPKWVERYKAEFNMRINEKSHLKYY